MLSGPWMGHATDDDLRRECIESTFDDRDWLPMTVPGHWAEHERLSARRSVLYRTRFELRAEDRERVVMPTVRETFAVLNHPVEDCRATHERPLKWTGA